MPGLLDNQGGAPGLLGNFQRGLAQIADPKGENVMRMNRQRALAELQQGASLPDVARKLAQIGDIDGFQALTRMADVQAQREYNQRIDARDFDFRKNEAGLTRQHQDRSYELQRQMAGRREIPAGFESDATTGGLKPLTGGPADPKYKREVGDRQSAPPRLFVERPI